MILFKVISGGQTGADQAGLAVAQDTGLETGGYAPYNFKTERGSEVEKLKGFGLVELASRSYHTRTVQNVKSSDATLIIGDVTSAGSRLTENTCKRFDKPCLVIPFPSWSLHGEEIHKVIAFLEEHRVRILNVAGNRESKNPGIYHFAYDLLHPVFTYPKSEMFVMKR